MTLKLSHLAIHNVVERAHLLWQLEQARAVSRTSVENMLDSFWHMTGVRDKALTRIVDFSIGMSMRRLAPATA